MLQVLGAGQQPASPAASAASSAVTDMQQWKKLPVLQPLLLLLLPPVGPRYHWGSYGCSAKPTPMQQQTQQVLAGGGSNGSSSNSTTASGVWAPLPVAMVPRRRRTVPAGSPTTAALLPTSTSIR